MTNKDENNDQLHLAHSEDTDSPASTHLLNDSVPSAEEGTLPKNDVIDKKYMTDSHPTDRPGGVRWAVKINRWLASHVPTHSHLIIVAILIGAVTGVASFIFRWAIGAVAGLFIPHIKNGVINWWLVVLPIFGIFLTTIFTRYVVRTNLTHGTAKLIADLKAKRYRLRHNLTFSSIVGGTITLGMGGSSGSEGPIAYTGAAIGSNIGQLLGIPDRNLKVLIGCGAAAGIAAVFMAPIGGLMYALELLCINISVFSVLAVTTSCISAYLIVYLLRGGESYFHFTAIQSFDTHLIPITILLGIFCGLYCIYYSASVNKMDSVFKRVHNPWLNCLIGGVTVGVIVMLFPSMFSIGYPILQGMVDDKTSQLISGSALAISGDSASNLLLYAAAGILLFKGWAVSATNSSGGVGGDFAPTLYAGGMAGFLFAGLCNLLFATTFPVTLFTFLGMAAVMSGAIRTPLMAFFIVMEFSKGYDFALPLAIVTIVSYLTVKIGDLYIGKGESIAHHRHWFI